MKPCTKCGITKPAREYQTNRAAKDGLSSRCKTCLREGQRSRYYADPIATKVKRDAYYAKKAELILANNAKSRERHREKILAGKRDYYEKVKSDPEWQAKQKAKRIANRAIKREYDKRYRASIPQQQRNARARSWNVANPEKRKVICFNNAARRRAQMEGGCTAAELRAWLDIQTLICVWCGESCEDDYHIDHVVPLSKGGQHELINLAIACPTCNVRKNAKDPMEFAIELHNERIKRVVLLWCTAAAA